MKKDKETYYQLIRKRHILPAVIGLLVMFCLVIFVAGIVFEGVVNYFTEAQFDSEYKAVQYMAKLYSTSGNTGIKELLDKEGRDYFVLKDTDRSETVLNEEKAESIINKYGLERLSDAIDGYKDEKFRTIRSLYGEDIIDDIEFIIKYYEKYYVAYHEIDISEGNIVLSKNAPYSYTGAIKSAKVTSSGLDDKVTVFIGNGNGALEIKTERDLLSERKLSIYNTTTLKQLWNNGAFWQFFTAERSPVTIPFWISIELDNGECFVGKASFDLKSRDAGVIFVFVIVIALITLVMFIALLTKIIKRFTRQRKLLSVFFTDVVTKGHNWMWFTIKGEQLLKKKNNDKLNFAILDISFVKYNTFCVCHSVEEGEKVLEAVNRLLLKTINKHEACAHHGISSFAVIMQYADEDILKKKVKFILRHLQNVDPSHKFAFHVGIALIPAQLSPYGKYIRRDNIDIEKIYNNACAATATLESSDDSAIAFFDDKLVEEQKWIDIVNEQQQKALDNEEFVIYYQPKYNPVDDKLRGAEALIRWQSPEYGFVTPGRIIPIFEKNGFITEIDHYMITHVARDQKRWLDNGFNCVPVSVNVSRAHFIESDLAEQIRDAVDKEGAPRELIEIELTESAFFDDKKALISTIEKLKSYGFSVSMDDFGAGYSSLNSLKDMPLDVLKLDADFFRGESEGGRGEIVVSEAIKLAKALNMRTVAEGVEVRDQVDFLAKQGCDMIQGYYYAKPMAGADYELRMGLKSEENLAPSVLSLTDSATDVVVADNEVVEQGTVVADDTVAADDVAVATAETSDATAEYTENIDTVKAVVDSTDISVETETEVSVDEMDESVSEGINEMISYTTDEPVTEDSEETKAESSI